MNIRQLEEDKKGEDNCRGRNRGKEVNKETRTKLDSEGKGEVEEVK